MLSTTKDAQHVSARAGFRPRPLGRNSAAAEASPCEAGEARQEGALIWEGCRPLPNRVECESTSSLLLAT